MRPARTPRSTTRHWYNEAGDLTQTIDGDGKTLAYAYDAAGRLLSEVATAPGLATQGILYGYDSTAGGNKGIGQLTAVADPSGTAALTYDAQGRVTAEARTIGTQSYGLAYTYDANGAVTSVTYPSGRVIDYVRASDGRITAVKARNAAGAAQTNLATAIGYKPFGPLAALTYGNGLTLMAPTWPRCSR